MQFLPAVTLGIVGTGVLSAIDVVREEAKEPGNGDVSRNVSLGLGTGALGFSAFNGATRGAGGLTGGFLGVGIGAIAGALIGSQLAD